MINPAPLDAVISPYGKVSSSVQRIHQDFFAATISVLDYTKINQIDYTIVDITND